MNLRRSLLYVPGIRPDRFDKALLSGADMVCIDLEDGVALNDKQTARRNFLKFCDDSDLSHSGCDVVVRINSLKTADGLKDLLAIAESTVSHCGVMLTKVESPTELEIADRILCGTDTDLLALIETPRGLRRAHEIISSSHRVVAAMFGGGDYASVVGSDLSWDSLLYGRSQLAAATAGRVALIDVPYMKIDDLDGLKSETKRVIKLGFSCKAAIHPGQIKAIHQSFVPNEADIKHARQVVEAYAQAEGGVLAVNGHMIDQPLVVAAQRVLLMSGEH